MRERYRRVTLGLEDRHWWFLGRRRVLRAVLSRLELQTPLEALDAGCGGGGNLAELARLGRVVGLEPAPAAAAEARRRGLGEIAEGSLEELPFAPASFGLVAALDVVEHLDDPVRGLTELRRVTRPSGALVLTVPAYPRLWGPHDVINEHRRRYLRRTLVADAHAAGWRPLLVSHFNTLLLPLAAAHRALQWRRLGAAGAPSRSDFERTPAWLDPVLELPLHAEAWAIGRGAELPAGLSLIGAFRAR